MLEASTSTTLPKVEMSVNDPALIQFTGGTTGLPKGAVLTHANLVAGTMRAVYGVRPPPVSRRLKNAVSWPYCPIFMFMEPLSCLTGACSTVPPRSSPPVSSWMKSWAFWKAQEQITFFPAVPTMINAIINHPRADELELGKKLGLFNSGGGPMPLELIEQARDMGITYGEGWGMSETTSLGIANPLMGMSKAGSIGIPFPDMDVKLVDLETGTEEVPKGEPGELIVKGPLVMQGYWNNPEETAGQLKDGWLYTGDVVVQDEDDYFAIVDRKKDMIIAGGYNVYPREIDEVLFEHPKVADAVSVGVPDEYRGETVKAFVVVKPGETATSEEIIEFCREKLAAYKAPKIVEFREELPKSAVGKILRKVLRAEELDKANK